MKIPILRRLVIDSAFMGWTLAAFAFEIGKPGAWHLVLAIVAALAFVSSVDFVRGHLKKIGAVLEVAKATADHHRSRR